MEECNSCSDAGDNVQNNTQEIDETRIRASDLEDHGEDNVCVKNKPVPYLEGVSGNAGMDQACASKLDIVMSTDCSPVRQQNCLQQPEDHEKTMVQCLDSCMVIEKPEEHNYISADCCIHQVKVEESNFVSEVMELNDGVDVYGGMVENEKRDVAEDGHPHTGGLYLDELDDDVLLHIASLLEARVVKFSLSRVCVRFQEMFDNEAYWKSRILKRWPKKYPAVPALPDFNWLDACVEREDSHRVWSDPAANTRSFMYSWNLFAEVDSVHLMKKGRLLLSGDRNRNLNMIDLNQYKHGLEGEEEVDNLKEMLVHSDCVTHKGWIWCMTSVDNHLFTGSWDTYIRLFDINAAMVPISTYKCKSAVLSLLAEENEIVASCFDKKVYFIDRRSSAINPRSFHKQPVLSVAGNDQFIISGSEDKTISIFDRRAQKVMTRITLEHYPLCMSFRDNHLWFGDKRGQLHLYDASQGLFDYVGMYDIGHTDKMTGVISTRGAIFTCSGDKTIKVLTPSQDPDLIASLGDHSKEIAWLDYSHGVLASAGGEDSIGVWLPKHWDTDTYLV